MSSQENNAGDAKLRSLMCFFFTNIASHTRLHDARDSVSHMRGDRDCVMHLATLDHFGKINQQGIWQQWFTIGSNARLAIMWIM